MKHNIDSLPLSPLCDASGYDPIEDRLRANVRATIEAMFEEELAEFLGRLRYGRGEERTKGYRHGQPLPEPTGERGGASYPPTSATRPITSTRNIAEQDGERP